MFYDVTKYRIHDLCITQRPVIPLRCRCVVDMPACVSEILLFIEATDYRSNFAKTILFENCSCFSKIPFSISVESPKILQCRISIPAGH